MASEMVAQMSQAEFRELLEAVVEDSVERKLLEMLGDPDEGSEITQAVRERLLRQKQAVSRGEYGRSLDEIARDAGLE